MMMMNNNAGFAPSILKTIICLSVVLWMALPVLADDPGTAVSSRLPARSRVGSVESSSPSGSPVGPAVEKALGAGVAIAATNSVDLRKFASVTGDVVVNDLAPGPFLTAVQLSVDNVDVFGDVKAATIDLDRNASVGNVCVDTLTDAGATINGTVNGTGVGSYSNADPAPCDDTPPIFDPLPPFQTATAGSNDVVVPSNGTSTLGPGRVRNIVVNKNATLFLSGGLYEAASVTLDSNASLLFQSATDLRLEGRFDATKSNQIGPATGSGIAASEIIIYVSGSDSNGAPGSAAVVGEAADAAANFYVPNGTFVLAKNADMGGAVIAVDVILETSATLAVDSFFVNQPPVADPQTVFTINDAPVEITLSGSDPDNDDLTFSILVPPTKGTLGAITPIVPAPVPVLDRDGNPTGEFIQAPTISAKVTYTPSDPNPPVDEADAFTFAASDGELTGTAVVDINPDDPTIPDPETAAVDAFDATVETRKNTPQTISLNADSPRDPPVTGSPVPLTFSIVSLPSGSLQDENGNAIETFPFALPSPKVIYTPPPDVTGFAADSFNFRAEGTVGGVLQSDTATITIDILEAFELAPDSQATTPLNTPVQVTLTANPGGVGSGGIPLTLGPTVVGLFPGADIAGNVSDADGDGSGDGRDDLPGPAPVLIAAGVDVNLGATPSGAVTDPIGDATPFSPTTLTWTLNGVTFDDGGTASGTFDFNASTQTAADWNISTTAGSTLGAFTYTPANSSFVKITFTGNSEPTLMFQSNDLFGPFSNSFRQLRITPTQTLSGSGGTINIDLAVSTGREECINCAPVRSITAGSLSAAAPPASPDLLSATITRNGATLTFDVRFDSQSFDPGVAQPTFNIDTDENPATGFPGVDAANNDSSLIGTDFLLEIGGRVGVSPVQAKLSKFDGASFNQVGALHTVTVLSDGFSVIVPLEDFEDEGGLKFKVTAQAFLGGSAESGILDYASDLGLAPGMLSVGIQGVARVQIEWDIRSVTQTIDLARVKLTTQKGSVDDLDTFFFAGTTDQDGVLNVSDYQAPANQIAGVVLPVPPGSQTGDEGTFTFDVTEQLQTAINDGFDFFSVQGRVNESLAGQGFRRGLQICSTATGNLAVGKEPQLEINQSPPPSLVWTVTSLPLNGTLTDTSGGPVVLGQTFTTQPTLVYTPDLNFSGSDGFTYQVAEGATIDNAIIGILVNVNDVCVINGREPGCAPGQ